MPTPNIVPVREVQIDIAAGVLDRAFQLDPPMVYVWPDATVRARVLPSLMKAYRHLRIDVRRAAHDFWKARGGCVVAAA
jgi:hypothetical protein